MSLPPDLDRETRSVTVECSSPGEKYTLTESGPALVVHLAQRGRSRGTGPCLCGFDRFAANVGFSVDGGIRGPDIRHEVCAACSRVNAGRPVTGIHADLFASSTAARRG